MNSPYPALLKSQEIPALCFASGKFALLTAEGEIKILDAAQAQFAVHNKPVLVCHGAYTRAKLGNVSINAVDVLELFAFVHPGKFCVPTPAGLAKALGQVAPQSLEDYPLSLKESAAFLLDDLSKIKDRERILGIAEVMGLNGRGWAWTPHIFAALGEEYDPSRTIISRTQLNVWKELPEWTEESPLPPPSHHQISGDEAREKLNSVLSQSHSSESRAPQMNYTTRLIEAFRPRDIPDETNVVLAEAGTGVGKTLGYLIPSSLYAEKNEAAVWISTYTKNLQRQIETELTNIYPDQQVRDSKVSIRKGRENYLCLLNFDDLASGAGLTTQIKTAIAAGIMARWIMETREGDLTGFDFPGWLPGLLGHAQTVGLADRRGECIFSACDHYKRCFTERAIRKAKQTPLVIANHAVVMHQTALAGMDENLPQRYVFDEGHHLFDAADSAFAAHLTGQQTYDLRRWIMGPEGGRRSRARGLKKRLEDLLAGDEEGISLMDRILHFSKFLTSEDWLKNLKAGNPQGSAERFIEKIFQQVQARCGESEIFYSLETPTYPLITGLLEVSDKFREDMKILRASMLALIHHIKQKLDAEAETLAPDTRKRLDAVSVSLERRASMTLPAWIAMLDTLASGLTPVEWVDWMSIERIEGKTYDVGMYRHHVDPTKAFATSIKPHAHSVIVTSATLRDGQNMENQVDGWETAENLTGATHLTSTPVEFSIPSPFDYGNRTKIFIINDIQKNNPDQLATAYRELFLASGGGALGLFTSISRLKATHSKIEHFLSQEGITLYSQHVDGVDAGTLVDMFRDDTHSCLFGTDAVRDGVDVPGESLRMIVFDRVPWPRATLLHKSRKQAFGGSKYDDRLTRLKLKQAYGRLIRKSTDRGVFIMLDSALPQRLQSAFPESVEIEKIGLSQAIEKTRIFLSSNV